LLSLSVFFGYSTGLPALFHPWMPSLITLTSV
jgi:hypothetical protein